MPDLHYYQGRSLSDSLRAFAEHHFEVRTRHISWFEHEMLNRAAEALDEWTDRQYRAGTQRAG